MRASLVRLLQSTVQGSNNARLRLGFIGLGAMGRHMASNLYRKTLLEHQASKKSLQTPAPALLLFDANEAGIVKFLDDFPMENRDLEEIELEFVPTPEMLARRSDVIFTALPSSPEVKSVYLGENGILSGLGTGEGKLCVDATTLDVAVARDVASAVSNVGSQMVDAPMSGGIVGAKAGTLSFMVGGEEAAFKRAEPYLSRMGSRVIHCGPSGMGLAAKISNNLILGINQIAVAEGLLLGTSLGLDPALLTEIINNSTGRSWPSSVNNPIPGALKPPASPPCERNYEGGFASKLMLKDLNLAMRAAEDTGVPLPLGSKATEEYNEVVEDGELARKDFSVVYQHLRRQMRSPS